MPATLWTVHKSKLATGLTPTLQAVDSVNGNRFPNNGTVRLRFKGAASATGQIQVVAKKCNYGTVHSHTSAVNALDTATEILEFGPFEKDHFNDENGDVTVTYLGTVTGITVSVIEDAATDDV